MSFLRWLFGLCPHQWEMWSDTFIQEVKNKHTGPVQYTILKQRRKCKVCGMSEIRTVKGY